MFKKIIVSTLALGVTAGVLLGGDVFSYVSTFCHRATDGVKQSVPVGFQIDRARQLVRDLDPEVRRSMQVIAREEIELEGLNERIEESEGKAEASKDNIMRLQADLGNNTEVFQYVGRSYSREQVTEDLSRRFLRHKVQDETLGHLTQMRDARTQNLDAARQKLTAMISAKNQLEADIVNLEAKQNLVTVAQASSDLMLDDSQLARAKGLVADIRSRLDVSARLANADTEFVSEIKLDPAQSEKVTDQVAAYFGIDSSSDSSEAIEELIAMDTKATLASVTTQN